MAELGGPCPPGRYDVGVVGSGPGGLQVGYGLARRGISCAVLSADDSPGGMFREFPLFQRLITWTKPYSPAPAGGREYERYDWNSLIGEDEAHQATIGGFMDGTSYFPARDEMEKGLIEFAHRTGIAIRYGCRWEATRAEGDGFVLTTSDGEYRCKVAVFAVGMTRPWKPAEIPGMDEVPHYVDTKPAEHYAGRSVFVVGKRNSGFEIADGLLPYARQIVLASPRPARVSVKVNSTAAARARYLQPYEDHVLGGGNVVLDAAIERIERHSEGFVVHAQGTTRPGPLTFTVDEVIAATGFSTPLGDLPELGVRTFYGNRLPAQTPFWASATVPGIYFAGSISQGSIGLKRYGIPSNSAAVHGFRYNARVLVNHITAGLGLPVDPQPVDPGDLVDLVVKEATTAPELWNQQGYLARVVSFSGSGVADEGIVPLAHFVDAGGPDAIAVTVETDDTGDIHPALYERRANRVKEHLLPSHPMLDFTTDEHRTIVSETIEHLGR